MSTVQIDTREIVGWDSLHDVFSRSFGFPGFYGRNMDAWNDCMTYLDDPDAGMSTVHAQPPSVVLLELLHVVDFRERCPEQYAAIVECSAFVNYRRAQKNLGPVLALSFYA